MEYTNTFCKFFYIAPSLQNLVIQNKQEVIFLNMHVLKIVVFETYSPEDNIFLATSEKQFKPKCRVLW